MVKGKKYRHLSGSACCPPSVVLSGWVSNKTQEITLPTSHPQLPNHSHADKSLFDALGHPPGGQVRLNHSSGHNL